MTDDTFHLTPHDVRQQEFQRVLRGFDPVQVEDFKQRMAEEVDRLLRERSALNERLANMVEQLRVFRDRERAMNDALVAAQQLRVDSQTASQREADMVSREAQAEGLKTREDAHREAQRIVEQAARDEQLIRHRNDAARRQYTAFLTSFRALLDRQMAELAGLEMHAEVTQVRPADAPIIVERSA